MFDGQSQHQCVDCGVLSPLIDEGDTFLSSKLGWRLHRFQNVRNEIQFEWRCPTCWDKFKAGKPSSPMNPPGLSAPTKCESTAILPRPAEGSYSFISERTKGGKGHL